MTTTAKPLTPTMLRILRNIRDHGTPFARGFHGLSEHGGAGGSLRALERRGLVFGYDFTAKGRQALAEVDGLRWEKVRPLHDGRHQDVWRCPHDGALVRGEHGKTSHDTEWHTDEDGDTP